MLIITYLAQFILDLYTNLSNVFLSFGDWFYANPIIIAVIVLIVSAFVAWITWSERDLTE